MPRTARLPLAFSVALALVLGADGARAETPDREVARLEREWAGHLLASWPHEAARLGLPARDLPLVPVTQPWIESERAWLAAFAARLDAVHDADLPPAPAAARDSLAREVARLREAHDVRRVWEREPAAYAALAGEAIADVLAQDPPCTRARRATRRLRLVPETLRAARVNLREVSRGAAEQGAREFEDVLALYRTGIPARTGACHDEYVQAALSEADTAAVRAVESFLVFLREDLRPDVSR